MGEGSTGAIRAVTAHEAVKRTRLTVAQWFTEPEGESVVIRLARGGRLELAAGEADDVKLISDGTHAAVVLVAEEASKAAVAAE